MIAGSANQFVYILDREFHVTSIQGGDRGFSESVCVYIGLSLSADYFHVLDDNCLIIVTLHTVRSQPGHRTQQRYCFHHNGFPKEVQVQSMKKN